MADKAGSGFSPAGDDEHGPPEASRAFTLPPYGHRRLRRNPKRLATGV